MKLRLHSFELQLAHPFTISRGTVTTQPTLIVELEEDGCCGFGEATTNPYYHATLEEMSAALEAMRGQVESASSDDPASVWQSLAPQMTEQPFALCALDMACWDLLGKRQGNPLYEVWGLDPGRNPATSYTIGLDEPDAMVAKLCERPDFPIYKIKLGSPQGSAHDLELIRRLRQGAAATFRVDANCGWSPEETVQLSGPLRELDVEFIEQPLAAFNVAGMLHASAECQLPIIADESCIAESDVAACAEQGFAGVNIKLVKCGGLTPARRMITTARELGLSVMVGCMTESSVGISAIAHLLPLLDYVDMDGALLLASDIASGVHVEAGRVIYSDVPGTGATLL